MSFFARARRAFSRRPWQLAKAEPLAAVSEEEAYEIGVETLLYFCPLVLMDLTRRQFIQRCPMNHFQHSRVFYSADFRAVVRPNCDTMFSVAWLDLRTQPQVVSVPNTAGRYYILQMMDMWTDTFATVGKRTTGTGAGYFAVVPPGWRGTLPAGVQRIESPTWFVWIIGRTQTNGPKDYTPVYNIQNGYYVFPLSRWRKFFSRPVAEIESPVDLNTPPLFQLKSMPAAQFLAYAARLLQSNPPHPTDQPVLVRMKRIGIERGKPFDLEKASPSVKGAVERALVDIWKGEHTRRVTADKGRNGWQIQLESIGAYGGDYVRRAAVAVGGLGANRPEDAVYPFAKVDSDGNPLHGSNCYTLHFTKAEIPPVSAFWSITLYDPNGFPTENPLNRLALSDRDPLRYNDDGSLTLYVQTTSPGTEQEPNWLPAPPGNFNLNLRLYSPGKAVLDGTWTPPPVKKMGAG